MFLKLQVYKKGDLHVHVDVVYNVVLNVVPKPTHTNGIKF